MTDIKNYIAESAVEKHRIVKLNSNGNILHANAKTNKSYGVTTDVGAEANERIDVQLTGLAEVEAGGAIIEGDFLVAGADGKAVALQDASGTNYYIGQARAKAESEGEIIPFTLCQGVVHLPTV